MKESHYNMQNVETLDTMGHHCAAVGSSSVIVRSSAYFSGITEGGRCKSKLFMQMTESRRNKSPPGENQMELDSS